jgi:hypothetical protein
LIRVVFGAQIFLIISNAYVVVFHGTIQISTYRPDSSTNLLPTHIPCIKLTKIRLFNFVTTQLACNLNSTEFKRQTKYHNHSSC